MLSPPTWMGRLGWNFRSIHNSTRTIAWGTFPLPVGTSKPEVGFLSWNPLGFGTNFFLVSIKTHSETIFSLFGMGENGNTDKNLFVQENTVIWGHLRSTKVKQGQFRPKRFEIDEKGRKVLKRDGIFIKYYEFPLKFWWRHHLFEVHFEVLLTVFGEFTVLRRDDESSEFQKPILDPL